MHRSLNIFLKILYINFTCTLPTYVGECLFVFLIDKLYIFLFRDVIVECSWNKMDIFNELALQIFISPKIIHSL